MGTLIAALIAAAVAGVTGVTSTFIANHMNAENIRATNKSNEKNVQATNEANVAATNATNATNLQIAQENNQTQLDLAAHGISMRMEDLKEAGLNPVMAAGYGTPQATLSTPTMQAPRQQAFQGQAPQFDFSGIGNAVNAVSNLLLTKYITDQKIGASQNIAQGYQQTSTANSEARNSVLRDLYQRKADFYNKGFANNSKYVNSAKQIDDVVSKEDWSKIVKELNSIGKMKYNWKH